MLLKLSVFLLPLFLFSVSVSAYNPIINEVMVPYDVTTISDLGSQTEHLGELKGDPHMYEFAVGEATDLKIYLLQLESDTPIPLSLIVVKQNEDRGGVTEIGRLSNSDWQNFDDKVLGLSLSRSQLFEKELRPGIYRVEVSTPENYGKYALVVGDIVSEKGFFSKIADIYTFQTFFGGSVFSMLKSSYIYHPLGIIIILVLFYITWRKKEFITRKINV